MMLNLLSRIIPVYTKYTTQDGNRGVKARTWHPAWLIPVWRIKVNYWLNAYHRYQSYQDGLYAVNCILHNEEITPKSAIVIITELTSVIEEIDCGYECHFTEPYSFVPEASCPIHD